MLLDLEDIVTVGLPESPTAAKIKEDRKAQAHIRLKLGDKVLDQCVANLQYFSPELLM